MATDGRRQVVAGDSTGRVHVWEPGTSRPVSSFAAHTQAVSDLALSADGAVLASAAYDGTIRLWAMSGRRALMTLEHPRVCCIAFSRDGQLPSVGSEGTIRLWSTRRRSGPRELRGPPGQIRSVAFSPDGATLASGHIAGEIVLWDVAPFRELTRLAGHAAGVTALEFSSDGRRLVSGSTDSRVLVWDMATKSEVLELEDNTGFVNSVAVLPDMAGIVSGGSGRPLLFWPARTR
jgi:WD40 repeat protein